jgi:hypothetical protein
MNFVKQQDSFSNNIVYCPMNQTCPNQPLFACTFIFFSKSIYVCCLRNSSSQTSFIGLTKYLKYLKSCGFSNFVLVVTSISNLIFCKCAQSSFVGPNGIQSNNTTCIVFLYKIVVMWINIFHDLRSNG